MLRVTVLLLACGMTCGQEARPPQILSTFPKVLYFRDLLDVKTLECQATGIPDVSYQWKENGTIIRGGDGDFVTDEGNLTMTGWDDGFYQCFAENRHGTAMSSVIQMITAEIDTFGNLTMGYQTFDVGEHRVLTCRTKPESKPAATVTWYTVHNGRFDESQPVQTNARVVVDQAGDLHFINIQKTDEMSNNATGRGILYYHCSLYNPLTQERRYGNPTRLTAIPGAGSPAPRNATIYFKTTAKDAIAYVGQPISLQCIPDGFPLPTVEWSKTGGPLPAGRYLIDPQTYMLTINGVTEDDEGEYKCEAVSGRLRGGQSILVDVKSAPIWVKRLKSLTLTEGETARFSCVARSAHGEADAVVTQWFRNGNPLNHTMGRIGKMVMSGDRLEVQDIKKPDDLMNIQCKVANTVGYEFADAFLNVLEQTMLVVEPEDRHLIEPDDVERINIMATADPLYASQMTYTWAHNNKTVKGRKENGDPVYVTTDYDLVINATGFDENEVFLDLVGKYTCLVSLGLDEGAGNIETYTYIDYYTNTGNRRLEEIAWMDNLTLETASEIAAETAELTKNSTNLQPVDVVYVSLILQNTVKVDALDLRTGQSLGEIVDNMFEVNSTVLHQAEKIKGTSKRITQSVETYTLTANLSAKTHARLTFRNLVMEMWNLDENVTVTGIKALNVGDQTPDDSGPSFIHSLVTIIEDDNTRPDGDIGDIDVAILLKPDVVKREIQAREPDKLRLSFIIQRKDVLFQEPLQNKTTAVNSRIISARFSNLTLNNLTPEDRVRTIFKPLSESTSNERSPKCVFWDYDQFGGQGGWSSEGCSPPKLEDGRFVCLCNHLTNFAILFEMGDVHIDPIHERALSIITFVGLSLSLIGVGITVVFMLQFRSLRADTSQKVFFNLALALMVSWTLFLVGAVMSLTKVHHRVGCEILAVCLHYFLLASFMWMLVEAIMQYLRYVKVLGTYIPRFLIKVSIASWGIPTIPVVILLSVNHQLYYRGDGTTPPRFCWMDQHASYFAFLLPVGLIMIFNMAVFISIAWKLSRRSPVLNKKFSPKESKLRMKAGFGCFLLLGLTWVFGYLTIEDARIPFQYIFTILNAFYGLFIFLFFVLREKRFRDKFCGVCHKTDTGISSTGTRYDSCEQTQVKATQGTEEIDLTTT